MSASWSSIKGLNVCISLTKYTALTSPRLNFRRTGFFTFWPYPHLYINLFLNKIKNEIYCYIEFLKGFNPNVNGPKLSFVICIFILQSESECSEGVGHSFSPLNHNKLALTFHLGNALHNCYFIRNESNFLKLGTILEFHLIDKYTVTKGHYGLFTTTFIIKSIVYTKGKFYRQS